MPRKQLSEPRQALTSVLAGMVGAWLWESVGKKILNRIPVWWRIIGGLLLGSLLLFIDGLEWFGLLLLVATVGLMVATITRRIRSEPENGPSQVARQWAAIIEENPLLWKVLRGSRAQVLESDASGFTICIELVGGHTPDEVQALTRNLECVFHTPPNTLRIYGDPTASWKVLLRAGDARPGTQKPQTRTVDGPIIDMPVVEVKPKELPEFSLARVMRGRARPRTRGGWVNETVRLEELKRRAELARERGERSGKGGRRKQRG
jgi:hypothetical protein